MAYLVISILITHRIRLTYIRILLKEFKVRKSGRLLQIDIKKTKYESMARPCFDPWLLLWLCNIDRPRHFLSGIERCKRHPPSNRDSRHHLNVCHHFRRTGKPGMTTLTRTCSLSMYLLQREFCIKFRAWNFLQVKIEFKIKVVVIRR